MEEQVVAEESYTPQLKEFATCVLYTIMMPISDEASHLAKPSSKRVKLSNAMVSMIAKAKSLKILHLDETQLIINMFKQLAWCYYTMGVVARKPHAEELREIVEKGELIDWVDDRGLRICKNFYLRTTSFIKKARKALMAVPGEMRGYDIGLLQQHAQVGKQIPMKIPQTLQLVNTIEDEGKRYCLCGGPSDGSFMLNCDECDGWFHGGCLRVTKTTGELLEVSVWIESESESETTK